MSWFGNRNIECNETDNSELKPQNQILKTPERETPESREKLDRFQDKPKDEQEKIMGEQADISKQHQKLDRPNASSQEGDPSKGQRQLERGHEVERE